MSNPLTNAEKPACKYGAQCYRKNPVHLQEYSHPEKMTSDLQKDQEPPASKRPKASGSDDVIIIGTDTDIASQSSPPGAVGGATGGTLAAEGTDQPHPLYRLTTVRGIGARHNRQEAAVGIKDLLSMSGELVASAQFNYMFDVEWLMQQYPQNRRRCPLLLVHGDQRNTSAQMRRDVQGHPHIKLLPAKLNDPFGTHHSKMMLLHFKEGLRVVIHTANLIPKDWDQKTQGVWISPLFPKLTDGATSSGCGSKSDFKQDLKEYLQAYGSATLREWIQLLESHDTSATSVRLVGSVPGAHKGVDMNKWGHLKLRRVLSECCADVSVVGVEWPVIGQFSSVGSLGPRPDSWLVSEWLLSLSTVKKKGPSALRHLHDLQLVFPSVDNVRRSLEGYMAGGSIPYATKTALKQPFLTSYFRQWRAELAGRSAAAPHIKSYCRVSKDGKHAAWFLLTSANLSKAAWGALEKKESQLRIRSYEIGVLFLPSQQVPSKDYFTLRTTDSKPDQPFDLSTPYDLPLTRYTETDEPWIWDKRHAEPDSHGNIWSPS